MTKPPTPQRSRLVRKWDGTMPIMVADCLLEGEAPAHLEAEAPAHLEAEAPAHPEERRTEPVPVQSPEQEGKP